MPRLKGSCWGMERFLADHLVIWTGFRAEAECLYLCDELASNRKRDG